MSPLKSLPVLSDNDVERLIPRLDVLDAMRRAFSSLGRGTAIQPPQLLTLFPRGLGDFITYLGVLAEERVFGAKLSPYLPHPTGAVVTAWTVLLSMDDGQPLLLCDSGRLTTERTAATSALAVDLLAPESPVQLAVIGSGAVAQAHIRHVARLRAWEEIRVYSPGLAASPGRCKGVASIDERVRIAKSLDNAVSEADVVLLCTSSGVPVVDPLRLKKQALITSISTNVPGAHEIPPAAIPEMDVYCDYRATTPQVAGEMVRAASEHGWSLQRVVADISELLTTKVQRPGYDRQVYFRSVGLGLEDVVIANALRLALPH